MTGITVDEVKSYMEAETRLQHQRFVGSMYGEFGLSKRPNLVRHVRVMPLEALGFFNHHTSTVGVNDFSTSKKLRVKDSKKRVQLAGAVSVHESGHYLTHLANPQEWNRLDHFMVGEVIADYGGLIFAERSGRLRSYYSMLRFAEISQSDFIALSLFRTRALSIRDLVYMNSTEALDVLREHLPIEAPYLGGDVSIEEASGDEYSPDIIPYDSEELARLVGDLND